MRVRADKAFRLEDAARLVGVALLLAASGCPSSTPAPTAGVAIFCGVDGGTMVPGTISNNTSTVVVVLGATSGADGLRFSIRTPADVYPSLTFFAALPGTTLEAITYDDTNGTAATTLVQEAATGGVTWLQTSAALATLGAFRLVLTDAGPAVAVDGGTSWPSPQGSLGAILVPVGTLTDAGIGVAAYSTGGFCACGSLCD